VQDCLLGADVMENQENLALTIQKEMIQFNLKRMRTVALTMMYISLQLFITVRSFFQKQNERWCQLILPSTRYCFI